MKGFDNIDPDSAVVRKYFHGGRFYCEKISIAELASLAGYSDYYLSRKFKEETGYSMHQYILEKRIQAARSLILTGVPATVASAECGFKDYSTFSRACKKILGKMPSEVV